MNFQITVSIIVSLATIAWTGSASWGKLNINECLLYREDVIRAPKNGSSWKVFVNYPENRPPRDKINISAINVIDHLENNSGFKALLWSGGPGHKFVHIDLKSQHNGGINSTVEIFGRRTLLYAMKEFNKN